MLMSYHCLSSFFGSQGALLDWFHDIKFRPTVGRVHKSSMWQNAGIPRLALPSWQLAPTMNGRFRYCILLLVASIHTEKRMSAAAKKCPRRLKSAVESHPAPKLNKRDDSISSGISIGSTIRIPSRSAGNNHAKNGAQETTERGTTDDLQLTQGNPELHQNLLEQQNLRNNSSSDEISKVSAIFYSPPTSAKLETTTSKRAGFKAGQAALGVAKQHKTKHSLPSVVSLVKSDSTAVRRGKGAVQVEKSGKAKGSKGAVAIQEDDDLVVSSRPTPSGCFGKGGKAQVSLVANVFGEKCPGSEKGSSSGKGSSPKSQTTPAPTPCNTVKVNSSGKGKGKGGQAALDVECNGIPTNTPSFVPSVRPSISPTNSPSESPTTTPSESPSQAPSASPTNSPSSTPTFDPSSSPSVSPTVQPSSSPSHSPTGIPTLVPTPLPSHTPSSSPTSSQAPSTPPITLGALPFRLEFDGVANASTSDFEEVEALVLAFLDQLFFDTFASDTAIEYSGIRGGASSFLDAHIDFDIEAIFEGSSTALPPVTEIDELIADSLISQQFIDFLLPGLSPSSPFLDATSLSLI